MAGWPRHDPSRLGGLGVGCALPAGPALGRPHRLVGFTRTDLYLSTVLCLVPLSVNLSEFGLTSIGWYMPTEPMLFALLVLFVAKWFSGQTPTRLPLPSCHLRRCRGIPVDGPDRAAQQRCGCSLKAWVSRAWFIVSFYVLLAEWFRQTLARAADFWPFCSSLSVVIGYTLVRHAATISTREQAIGL